MQFDHFEHLVLRKKQLPVADQTEIIVLGLGRLGAIFVNSTLSHCAERWSARIR